MATIRRKSRYKNKKPEDVFKTTTDTIVAALEAGVKPWVKPWNSKEMPPAYNGSTGRRYTSTNSLMLNMASSNHTNAAFLTYNQAKKLGGQVRKGEKAYKISIPRMLHSLDGMVLSVTARNKAIDEGREDEIKTQSAPYLSTKAVFNLDQIEGLQMVEAVDIEEGASSESPIKAVKLLVGALGVKFRVGGNKAFYDPLMDIIQIPHKSQFKSEDDFCATMIHEIAHWTGSKHRLDRDMSSGGDNYAIEEIIAEMSASCICRSLGITGENAPDGGSTLQHAEYIGYWIESLKSDKKEIFKASKESERIISYIGERFCLHLDGGLMVEAADAADASAASSADAGSDPVSRSAAEIEDDPFGSPGPT